MNDSLHTNTVTSNFEKELMSVFSNCPLCFSCCVSVDILPLYAFVFSLEQPQGRCKSMESLLIQEQNKSSPVFYAADDSSSESNTSEMSRHRDEEAHSPRKHNTRSRTPEPRKEKISDSAGSPRLSSNMPQNMTHAQSVPILEGYDRTYRTPSRVLDKSPLSRVSYKGSSPGEYQVRYVGGYRSGPEDESDEPIRLTTYDRSPTRHRRGSDTPDSVDVGRIEGYTQSSSIATESSTSSIHYVRKSREERKERDIPTSSPYLRRKAQDIPTVNTQSASAAGSSPVPVQKQKKTAIVSPLFDVSESNRPRSVPPGLMMFDPTDPESERVEQVSNLNPHYPAPCFPLNNFIFFVYCSD